MFSLINLSIFTFLDLRLKFFLLFYNQYLFSIFKENNSPVFIVIRYYSFPRIKRRQFQEIVRKICLLFPEEKPEFYYSIVKRENGSVIIGGVLYNHYLRCRKMLYSADMINGEFTKRKTYTGKNFQSIQILLFLSPNFCRFSIY